MAGASPREFIFTFDSVRDAIDGENLLREQGIAVMVMPFPRQLGSRCGICLRVSAAELKEAEKALTGGPSGFREIYASSWAEETPADGGGLAAKLRSITAESRKSLTLWKKGPSACRKT
ncbi:MAG: DUF3343 domain-containing protein [Treponema sp.]|jgi:hypothetical protein|nr:DUF3343 domain-containing protein [Treponema sp.]